MGFGRVVNGKLGYDPQYLFLKTRFKPGYTYEVSYETRNPIIAGLGFAAIRDAASAFKYDSEAVVRGRYAYALVHRRLDGICALCFMRAFLAMNAAGRHLTPFTFTSAALGSGVLMNDLLSRTKEGST